uniref:GPI ethanolamine phosphate transferase 3 n=1 Tax=Panagrolaimus sp. JU765 TaxID=591449 RepID=A0AC34QNE6_9BILA
MILGDGLAPSLFLLIFIQDAGLEFFDDSVSKAFFTSFLVAHGFFSLAHTATLAQIPWQAAFIGIPGNFAFQAVPGALVILHIFASCVLLVWRNSSLKDSNDSTNLALLAIGSFKACGVCLAALFHRRHLMLFKIFAPKFIYEGIGFILLCLALLFFQMLGNLNVSLMTAIEHTVGPSEVSEDDSHSIASSDLAHLPRFNANQEDFESVFEEKKQQPFPHPSLSFDWSSENKVVVVSMHGNQPPFEKHSERIIPNQEVRKGTPQPKLPNVPQFTFHQDPNPPKNRQPISFDMPKKGTAGNEAARLVAKQLQNRMTSLWKKESWYDFKDESVSKSRSESISSSQNAPPNKFRKIKK